MKYRIVLSIILLVVLLTGGALPGLSFTSPLVGLELCEGWPYMPHPDWPNCEYFEECLCWMRPVDEPPISPLATPVSIDRDGPEVEEQKRTTTPEQSRALACLVASRWWGFDDSICTGGY